MGIISKMKRRWKLMKEYDIKDLVKNIDLHADTRVERGSVFVTASSDKKYWKIVDALNRFDIDYNIISDRTVEIKVHHKHHDNEPDIFNSEGGFEIWNIY